MPNLPCFRDGSKLPASADSFAQDKHENELARSFEKFTIPSEEEGFQERNRPACSWSMCHFED